MPDTIDLIPNHTRLVIHPDADPLNPRVDSDTPVGCYRVLTTHRPFDGPPEVHRFPANLEDAHDNLWDYERQLDPEHVVARWARTFYNTAIVHDGFNYWWCDRKAWDMLVGAEWTLERQYEIIRHEIDSWQRYSRGEAVIVALERRATFKRVTPARVDESELLHVWERVDDIADIYLADYNESAIEVAAAHFTHLFGRRERAVVQAALDEAKVERVLSGE
jgi:hypothetical protein